MDCINSQKKMKLDSKARLYTGHLVYHLNMIFWVSAISVCTAASYNTINFPAQTLPFQYVKISIKKLENQ